MSVDEISSVYANANILQEQQKYRAATDKYSHIIDYIETRNTRDELTNDLKKILSLSYNNRGFINYQSVEFEDAIRDYTKAIEVDANLAVSYYNRGTVHYRLSQFDTAIQDMNQALFLNPKFEEAVTGLQMCEKDKKEKKERGY